MKTLRVRSVWPGWALLLLVAAAAPAQTMKPPKPAGAPAKTPYYIDPMVLDLAALVPDPPAVGSPQQKDELAELHRIEAARTAAQVAAAKRMRTRKTSSPTRRCSARASTPRRCR